MNLDKPDPFLVPFLTGAAGAIVSLRWMPGASWAERGFNVFCGLITAGLCTPYIVHRFEIEAEAAQYVIGFGVGMFGLAVLNAVREGMEQADLRGLIARLIRGRLGGQGDQK